MEYCIDLPVIEMDSSTLKSEKVDLGDDTLVDFFCLECDLECELRWGSLLGLTNACTTGKNDGHEIESDRFCRLHISI